MERTFVTLSRPLILRIKDNFNKYSLVYGFVVNEDRLGRYNDKDLDDYVGYLTGMHFWSAGADYFDVSKEYRGIPDWEDEDGVPHFRRGAWMDQMIEKSKSLLDISYDVIRMEIDDETFAAAVESDSFITSESLYDELEKHIERGESEDNGEEHERPC